MNYARQNDIQIIHVGLRFEKGYPEMGSGKSGLRKAIPKAGTFKINEFGSQFYETVKPMNDEFVVTGRLGASSFTASNLDTYLRNNRIENLYLAGYATHVCLESTLRDAHDKGYNTFLLSDATAAFNKTTRLCTTGNRSPFWRTFNNKRICRVLIKYDGSVIKYNNILGNLIQAEELL